ncbi:hypothetical protein F4804DRAFT_306859 [Jackrogersella minutella]|nr:hypothetical protein F4804DRAFT_306859 [Jackrogersella minutella]
MVKSGYRFSLVHILVFRASTLTRLEPNGSPISGYNISFESRLSLRIGQNSSCPFFSFFLILVPRGPARTFGSGVTPRLMLNSTFVTHNCLGRSLCSLCTLSYSAQPGCQSTLGNRVLCCPNW